MSSGVVNDMVLDMIAFKRRPYTVQTRLTGTQHSQKHFLPAFRGKHSIYREKSQKNVQGTFSLQMWLSEEITAGGIQSYDGIFSLGRNITCHSWSAFPHILSYKTQFRNIDEWDHLSLLELAFIVSGRKQNQIHTPRYWETVCVCVCLCVCVCVCVSARVCLCALLSHFQNNSRLSSCCWTSLSVTTLQYWSLSI